MDKTAILKLHSEAVFILAKLGEAINQLPDETTEGIPDPLSDLTYIGLIDNRPAYSLVYNNKKWVAEIASENPKQLVIRGANSVRRKDAKLLPGVLKDEFLGLPTGYDGMSQPTDFPATVPGYDTKEYPGDKRVYYQYKGQIAPVDTPVTQSKPPVKPEPEAPTGTDTGPMNDDYN